MVHDEAMEHQAIDLTEQGQIDKQYQVFFCGQMYNYGNITTFYPLNSQSLQEQPSRAALKKEHFRVCWKEQGTLCRWLAQARLESKCGG